MSDAANQTPGPPPAGLRGLDLRPGYDSGDDALEAFYVPALSRAVQYDRSVGYFRSSSLSVAARGVSRFINHGGTFRLLCGAQIGEDDRDALLGRSSLDGAFAERLADRLVTDIEVDRRRLEVLAWLAREGRLTIRVAVAVDDDGHPLVGGTADPYSHEKIGVLRDRFRDGVAFQGSVNESATAWKYNFESFAAFASWDASATSFDFWANKFEDHWAGRLKRFRVFPLPEAVRSRLISLAPDEAPVGRDPAEPLPDGDDGVIAAFVRAAPRLVGADGVAEATVGVQLLPHQRQVVARLAGTYPRSWLVADEVGLGKTVSAGMPLRRLLLDGRVRRALILAPANVCRQWQDELFEKLGLWVPRLDGNRVHGVHPDDVKVVPTGANPYRDHPVLIASSHLARRPDQQERLLAAGPYDLLVVDEAHHARRTHAAEDRYRPGRLLELLDKVSERGAAKAVWLLTATPMQVEAVELRDLLVHVGLQGPLADEDNFLRYFREVAKTDDARTSWTWLDSVLRRTPRLPTTGAEQALLDGMRTRSGSVTTARVEQFGTGSTGADVVADLTEAGRSELRRWLSALSPVGQFVTRHTRSTLRTYQAQGLLQAPLAVRDTEARAVRFTRAEQQLYDELDQLIDRLLAANGSRRGAGFVLTIYRRRLTSSWAAIRRTLTRRLDGIEALPEVGVAAEIDDVTTDDEDEVGDVDDNAAVPLTAVDLADFRRYIERLSNVPDSKFDQLQRDIDHARSDGRSTIVFTQFIDTLDDLRDRLVGSYRAQLATFTGAGGSVWRDQVWQPISKRDLVEAIRAGSVTILLATDAASEGLNLQARSYLVNYDMPWNPMRVEQRIGRIDRVGQQRRKVIVRSYFVPGTVEESVYQALAKRIDIFSGLLGSLQPILGATERAFRDVFRAPRSERTARRDDVIRSLTENVDTLESGGIDLDAEDLLPAPAAVDSVVTLGDLRAVALDRLGLTLDEIGRPVTWDAARASRDPESWTALATYGHPRLDPLLARVARGGSVERSALVLSGTETGPAVAVRADRTPPTVVEGLAELNNLGSPTARDDAEMLANGILLTEMGRRRAYDSTLRTLHTEHLTGSVREEFIRLVHDTIEFGTATTDPPRDPSNVWFELVGDPTSTWTYAPTFTQKLGVSVGTLISRTPPPVDRRIAADAWAQRRHESGQQLKQMMNDYQISRLS